MKARKRLYRYTFSDGSKLECFGLRDEELKKEEAKRGECVKVVLLVRF